MRAVTRRLIRMGAERFPERMVVPIMDGWLASRIGSGVALEQPPFFIMGSGRNGSTLVSAILNNHEALSIPPEAPFIPGIIRRWYTRPLASTRARLDGAFQVLEHPTMWSLDLDSLKQFLRDGGTQVDGPAPIIDAVYREFARATGKATARWGDKTPANTLMAVSTRQLFRNAKVLFLVRDPRDVMTSLLDANRGYYLARFDAMLWRWGYALRCHRTLARRFGDDIRLLKYEDFVRDPESSVRSLQQWLEVRPDPNILDGFGANARLLGVEEARHHRGLQRPVFTESIGRWEHGLSDDLARRVEKRMARDMAALGYL